MVVLVEAGFSHPQQEIRDTTQSFWDKIVVPAFAKDNIDAPEVLQEARKKSGQTADASSVVPDSTCSLVNDKEKPRDSHSVALFAFPEETVEVCTVNVCLLRVLKKWFSCHPLLSLSCVSISLYLYYRPLWWSRGSVLAFNTQVRGFKPGRSHRIFKGEKIRSIPSFRGEVKPSVPCHIFVACKRSLNGMEAIISAKLLDSVLAYSSTFCC
jgi:hypothetical protein